MIQACIFDGFGTLFSLDDSYLESIYDQDLSPLLNYAREKQLSYSWLHGLMGSYKNFEEITQIVLLDACTKFDVPPTLISKLSTIYFNSVIFDDVLPMLKSLKEKGIKTGILSNGTHSMLRSGIDKNSLVPYIDVVYSVDDIQLYKPDPAVYKMIGERENYDHQEILFISSNQWDVAGAFSVGLNAAWLNRDQLFRESIISDESIHEISSVAELISMISDS